MRLLFISSLLLAIIPLGIGAYRPIGPFLVGLIAFGLTLSGKFVFDMVGVTMVGVVLLIGAYLWSYRLHRQNRSRCSTQNVSQSKEVEQPLSTSTIGLPIACALDKAQLAERKIMVDRITQTAIERKGIAAGVALQFESHPGLITQLANFVELESACCPFLSFRIDVRAGGHICLELTGPLTAKEIIRGLIPER
jgi:hypothetical protein